MKKNLVILLVVVSIVLVAVPALAATYGKKLSDKPPVKISELIEHPDDYLGKVVKVEGIVTEVCEMRGCWMSIAGDKEFETLRFKVEDGVIVIPLTARGKKAVAEGTFTKVELTKEQALEHAKHMAEEQGREFDPSSVTGPTVTYQLQGIGAVIE